MYHILSYIVYIFHLNCFQGVNIFIVSFPTHAVLFQIAPRRNTKGHENIEKISILEWKDYTWRPFLRIKLNENMRNPAKKISLVEITLSFIVIPRSAKKNAITRRQLHTGITSLSKKQPKFPLLSFSDRKKVKIHCQKCRVRNCTFFFSKKR